MSKSAERTFQNLLAAQFLSALADNALLFGAIGVIRATDPDDTAVPYLQLAFLVAVALLCPLAASLTECFPKNRVLLAGNTIKLAGVTAMMAGMHPVMAYATVGLGASIYAPAKYGILPELLTANRLVKGNGMLEGSTILAILLGTITGGMLTDRSPGLCLSFSAGVYLASLIMNARMPKMIAGHPSLSVQAILSGLPFYQALWQILVDAPARLSLLGTSLFWGCSAAFRLLLLDWALRVLHTPGTTLPSLFGAATGLGIAVGAWAAGRWIPLNTAGRAFLPGLTFGPLMMLMGAADHWEWVMAVVACVGIAGGAFVVPMNAVLQERGHQGRGAGHAVAAQNMVETLLMGGMTALYGKGIEAGLALPDLAVALGGAVLIGMVILGSYWRAERCSGRRLKRASQDARTG